MAAAIQTCYRHPDRRAGVTCQRCERPICPHCMNQASVGFHCPECSSKGKQRVYTASTILSGSRPLVTQVLIAINVAVFIAGLGGGSGDLLNGNGSFITDYGLLGSLRFTVPGQGSFSLPLGVAHGEWYRLITGGFLHAGLIHIGFNMVALWILGTQLESVVGRVRFGVVYASSLLAGSLGVMILSPHTPTVGASGAIFGLFGLAIAAQRSQGIDIWQSGLGGILLINLALTFSFHDSISVGGHLGGLAGGYLCGVLLYELGPRLRNEVLTIGLCVGLGVACFAGSLVAASAFA